MRVRLAVFAVLACAIPASAQVGIDGLRRDTFALAPRQTTASLEARPIPGTETLEVFRDRAFQVVTSGYTLDGTGRLVLEVAADTVRFFAIAYRPAPVIGPVRARIPSVDSLRALYAPDTTGA
ncbi:hypothetical protein, partial [Rubrivirga sp.]|uniref:hypothetical protein n=1 Tax=Rubrivirga sp. TaxID=1885344 RepID=UPI003C7606EB